MSPLNEEFLHQLRQTFRIEAAEHVQAIAGGLVDLERNPGEAARRGILETIFRAAHSLKGAARSVDFVEVEALCQSIEGEFALWRRQGDAPSREALDEVHATLDAIEAALVGPARDLPAAAAPARIDDDSPPAFAASMGVAPPADRHSDETVRISVSNLDARMVQAEEMLAAKLAARQHVENLRAMAAHFVSWRREWAAAEPQAQALRQGIERPGANEGPGPRGAGLATLAAFLEWNAEHLKMLEAGLGSLIRGAERDLHSVGKLVDDLLAGSKQLLLLPFARISASFPKLVRDLCRDQGKEADLVIHGEDIEIDKRILEEIKDPLVHLLRNSIDHGIETPAERVKRGKAARATIILAVSRLDAGRVQVLLSDDGAGIDVAKVKGAAVRLGLASAAEAACMDDTQALAMLFQSGMSTSVRVTELSGRGLGLAIVRERAERLGGHAKVESRPGSGCTFRIEVPATRATFRGLLVEAAARRLVVPTAEVDHVMRAAPADVRTVEGRETVPFRGRAIPLVRLADVLELPPAEAGVGAGGVPLLILGTGEQRIAFGVDAVLHEQEVLVKPLGKPLSRVRNVAAATTLGSGEVVPILNVADLLKSARTVPVARPRPAAEAKAKAKEKAILVAEDSISSRMLLKGILEAAGYKVRTAVDGMEAITLLRADRFDLVVSDVEMPRLNGFDLTARIRADRKLSALPVILLTALATREDRERGVDAGANAYIVKGSFDQSDLLEAVRRLA